jgi:hypothetical protein
MLVRGKSTRGNSHGHGLAAAGNCGEFRADCSRNELAAGDDRINPRQSTVNIPEAHLRQQFAVHVQDNSDLRVEVFNDGTKLRVIIDMYDVTTPFLDI